jgi:hypothetical protein
MKPYPPPGLLRCSIRIGAALALLSMGNAAERLTNGDFSDWNNGVPEGWNRVSECVTTQVVLGDGTSAVQLGANSTEPTQALAQTFTGFGGGFLVKLTFSQQAPVGGARGANISVRAGGTPLLSFRSSSTGRLEAYDGSTSNWVAISGTAGAISPSNYSDGTSQNDPMYRLEIEGSLSDASYAVRLFNTTTGSLITSVSGLSLWQSTPTAASQLQAIHLERGRSGGDWRAYEVSIDDIDAPAPFVVDPNPTHPFLIVSADEYADWRQRALQEPWASVKTKTLSTATTLSYDPALSGPYRGKVLRLKTVVSACALASILDPGNIATYTQKAADQMILGLTNIRDTRVAVGGWEGNTPVGSTLFSCILALDVLHPHLDPAKRVQIENLIGPLVNSISGWNPSPASVRCLWALYRGDHATYQSNVSSYLSQLLVYFTDDGVMIAGTGYGNARMNYYDREQKHALVDILSRLGAVDGYSIAKLQRMYEWLYGSAYGHQGELHIFGDTSPNRPLWGPPGEYPEDSPTAAYAAWHFSAAAQAYANRLIADPSPQPSLLAYALLGNATRDLPATSAPSRIYKSGGAFFREATSDTDGLSCGMLNLTASEGHTHKETNAISLIGNGENLITNAGYAGYAEGSLGFSWDYINNRAVSANTVLIDYPLTVAKNASTTGDHVRKSGIGIVRGLITAELDYAVGDSGTALSAGVHQRGMAFAHPDAVAGTPGYWFLLDRVTSPTGTTAHLALHPFSTDVTTLSANQSYRWFVKRESTEGSYLSIHLASPPTQTQLLDGVFANLSSAKSFIGKFLYATYPIQSGTAHFGTAILPHKDLTGTPTVTSISGAGFKGMNLSWAGTSDSIFTADTNAGPVSHGPTAWNGTGCHVRNAGGQLRRFLVDRATAFSQGDVTFTSTIPCLAIGDASQLSIHLENPSVIHFRWPGAAAAFLDHASLTLPADGTGTFSANLPAGMHLIHFGAAMQPAYEMTIQKDTMVLGIKGLHPGKNYRYETSTDLVNWSLLKAGTATSVSDLFAHPADAKERFYRIVLPQNP